MKKKKTNSPLPLPITARESLGDESPFGEINSSYSSQPFFIDPRLSAEAQGVAPELVEKIRAEDRRKRELSHLHQKQHREESEKILKKDLEDIWERREKNIYHYIALGEWIPSKNPKKKKPKNSGAEQLSAAISPKLDEGVRFFTSLLFEEGKHDKATFWRMVNTMQGILDELSALAESGDLKAINAVHQITYFQIIRLRHLVKSQPKAIQTIASKQHEWPEFISPHPENSREISDVMARIKLGSQSYQKLQGKRVWTKIPSKGQPHRHLLQAYIQRLVNIVLTIKRQLHPIFLKASPGTPPAWINDILALPKAPNMDREQWWKVCSMLLKNAIEAHPNNFSDLARIGKFRGDAQGREAEKGRSRIAIGGTRSASERLKYNQSFQGAFERLEKAFYRRFDVYHS